MRLIAYSDGASRGNPGPAAIGALVLGEDGQPLAEISRHIGRGTNNEAEYRAAIAAVEAAMALGARSVELRAPRAIAASTAAIAARYSASLFVPRPMCREISASGCPSSPSTSAPIAAGPGFPRDAPSLYAISRILCAAAQTGRSVI